MITSQTLDKHRHITRRGKIIYMIESSEFPDGQWGFEHFTLTRHHNGERVIRAYCELWDKPLLIRDVFQRVNADFHPMESTVRLTEGDAFKGNAWYHFTYHKAEMQGYSADQGRVQGEMEITPTVRGFGNHSLIGDGWLVAKFDRSKGPGRQTFHNNPLTSIDHRGATGPALEHTTASTFEYFGEETITVKAGTFKCYHFAFILVSNNHPPYHLWVTADGDFMFVRGHVDAPYNWSFELTELTEN